MNSVLSISFNTPDCLIVTIGTVCENQDTSLEIDAELAAKAVRQHWHIENQQHWVLDVTFREDVSRLGDRESAEVFALLRRIALNMAQHHPKKISKRRKIKCSCWSDDFRMEMFFGIIANENNLQKV